MTHDPLCQNAKGTCCPWMGDCSCQCMCDFIDEIRADERNKHDIPVCDNCGERCWERPQMDKRTAKVYDAIFGRGKPLSWREDDDCGSRDQMLSIAKAAVDALQPKKKRKKK